MLFQNEDEEFYFLSDLELDDIGSYISPAKFTFTLRNVPTHTEDGIPIRKLYVSNLPPKTTRAELFGVFSQYGFIKSCWLRMGDKGPNKTPTPAYAFVTYSNPTDAHKALKAPGHEKNLRGRNLRISPADSWHQPVQGTDVYGRGKSGEPVAGPSQQTSNSDGPCPEGSSNAEASGSDTAEASATENVIAQREEEEEEEDPQYSILDILNQDCLTHILSYVPIRDLIRTERASKQWQSMVQEYLAGTRLFKTSWWQHAQETLTTAVLRRVLQRLGAALQRLHIDHHFSLLNDRTAHIVGKFCPNLEELKIVGMRTKNWNPLFYGCKNLKSLSFDSCDKLSDTSLVHLVKSESSISSLTVANNSNVTGLFLRSANPTNLQSLSFCNCYSLQGTVLSAAIDKLPALTTLRLDVCSVTVWNTIPSILKKLPHLQELSLSEYNSSELCVKPQAYEDFCKALENLTELRVLNLHRNICVSNEVLKIVAQTCSKLESLNVSACNSRNCFPYPGVNDDGIAAICNKCPHLRTLDISYLRDVGDAGARALAALPALSALTARGSPALSAAALAPCLAHCPRLQELDVCGSSGVSEELLAAAVAALTTAPRALRLWLAGTAAAELRDDDFPKHKLLTVNTTDDRSNPQLRPDFVDRVFDDSPDYDFDLYEHDDDEDDDDYDSLGEDDDLDYLVDEFIQEDARLRFLYDMREEHDLLLL